MVIKNGNTASANDVIASVGNTTSQLAYEQVKSDSSNWTNTDYLGADIFTDSDGAKNTIDTGNSTATYNNSTSDYYGLINSTDDFYYMIIEATSYGGSSSYVKEIDTGKWLIVGDSTNSLGLQKGLIHQLLWSSGDILNFTSITDIRVSDSDDVGKRGYKITFNGTTEGGADPSDSAIGTFGTTTGNIINSWSNLTAAGGNGATWANPTGTTLNDSNVGSSNEIGTDTSGDDATNPATCTIGASTPSGGPYTYSGQIIVFCKGTLSLAAGMDTQAIVNYYTDNSIPETTTMGSISDEGLDSGTVETNTIINEKVPDSIVVYGKTDLPANTSITVDVSDDGGTTFSLTGKSLNTAIDTSSFSTGNLALKFNLATTDTSITPKLYGYGISITDT